ncbi:hypothetical protein NPS01_32720 [Nocardioides psychrotolerans]|uniref:Uncharacterized protein n=1 Tax=Nocardioides psychrotolerans TaxID=1005945 RepID=A0A1I3P8B5_9ACTN|nr:hypothetical protein [Nocardioides psychrotolerans]GEP39609.1 hypothetical protein NPS01_32720 [Nocardioides psychrotolerans]SFJ17814.1 hypothetical protein SAMN05216561_1203 [Nocardioides psychrotolerans]
MTGGTTVVSPDWAVTGGTKTKPGNAVKVTNGNTGKRPTIMLRSKKIRTLATQSAGSTPAAIEDLSNGGSRTVLDDGPEVTYGGHGTRELVHRMQSVGGSRYLFGADGQHTKPSRGSGLTDEIVARGRTPGYVLCAKDAAADMKLSAIRNAADGRTTHRMYKDDGTSIGDAWSFKTNGATVTEFGVRGVIAAFAFTQTYLTADATLSAYTPDVQNVAYTGTPADAASTAKLADLNALRVAYENMRASHDALMAFTNSIVDAL